MYLSTKYQNWTGDTDKLNKKNKYNIPFGEFSKCSVAGQLKELPPAGENRKKRQSKSL